MLYGVYIDIMMIKIVGESFSKNNNVDK